MDQDNQDQADLLRKQMDEINQNQPEEQELEESFEPGMDDIDILNLPPRRVVHDDRKTKLSWKISAAFIRFFVILLIIITILVVTFNYWGDYFLINHWHY